MTDARFPCHWLLDQRFDELDPGALHLYAAALLWSVSNRTEGVVPDRRLDRLPWRPDRRFAPDLKAGGLWHRRGDNWIILDFEKTQTSAAQLDSAERAKKADRERKARDRAAKAASGGKEPDASGRKSTRTSDRIPKARSKASASASSEEEVPRDAGSFADRDVKTEPDWPDTAQVPGQAPPVDDALFDPDESESYGGSGAYSR